MGICASKAKAVDTCTTKTLPWPVGKRSRNLRVRQKRSALYYMIRGCVYDDTTQHHQTLTLQMATALDGAHTLIFHSSNLISGFPTEGSKYRFLGI